MSEKELSAEEIKRNTLPLLRHAETIYVLMSVCTKMPYVVCDPETYDDEVIVFVNEQAAKQEAVRLLQQGEPVQVVSVKNESLLAFYISLLPIGTNCLRVNKGTQIETVVQLDELIRRPDGDHLPEGQIRIENPELHLTALYFAQEFRKKREGGITEEIKELNEEMLAHFRRGKYIVAVQKEGQQIPILREKDGQMYQPLFTDIQEFNKFNKEKNLKAAIIEFSNLPKFLAPEAKGVIINPNAVNIKLDMARPKQPSEEQNQAQATEQKQAEV